MVTRCRCALAQTLFAIAGTLGCVCVAGAQQAGPHERPGDMPAPMYGRPPTSTPLAGSNGSQVNVNGQGLNIVGDAANEPSLAVDPTAPNRIAVGWRQFDSKNSNFREAGNAFSLDGGRTWTMNVSIENGVFHSDPVLEATSQGKLFYCSVITTPYTSQTFSSNDFGKTWGPKVLSKGGDKTWFVIDKSGLASDGFIYSSWNPNAGCCGSNIFTRSVDGGQTYMNPVGIPGSPWLGTLAVAANADLYVAGQTNTFVVARSTNAKNPQSTPSFQTSSINLGGVPGISMGSGPNPGGALGQTWVDVDRSNGPFKNYVYLVSAANPAGSDPLDVMFSRSTDGGVTWSTPVRINNDTQSSTHWQFFATMAVSPNGRIDVVWNDTRNSNQANICELFYAYSTDAGVTWQGNTAVSTAFDSYVGWPNQNKLGDYYDMESDRVGAFVAYAATFNGEQDVYCLRLGDYDCNGNGVPDTTDLSMGTAKDCNGNGIPDLCEIAAGTELDANGNGVPDSCEACYADCDGSGELDIDDFICFQTAYGSQSDYADCDGSGELDIDDFICFQTAYGVGCP